MLEVTLVLRGQTQGSGYMRLRQGSDVVGRLLNEGKIRGGSRILNKGELMGVAEAASAVRLVRPWPDHFSAGRWSHSQTTLAPLNTHAYTTCSC